MTKEITIRHGRIGRYDDVSPFVIAEDLRLEFEGLTAANGNYYVVVKLNERERKFKLNREFAVTLEREFFTAGELNVSVLYYLRGEKLAEYVIEPLAVRDATTDLSAEPVIAALTARIAALEEEADKLRKALEDSETVRQTDKRELTAAIEETNKRIDLIEGDFDPLRV